MISNAELTTDGWRGQPSELWAEQNIISKAAAFVASVPAGKMVAIGYDGRAGSHELALLTAHALSNAGVHCVVANAITPTPAVGRFVADTAAAALGLIMTASHNPPGDFGLKIRMQDGLPALQPPRPITKVKSLSDPFMVTDGQFEMTDAIVQHYKKKVCEPLAQIVKDFAGEVVIDSVFGAVGSVADYVPGALWRRRVPAPFFFGITPDPVLRHQAEPHMAAALAECKHSESAIAFMTDGDGDRLCLYTQASGYVTSTEQAMALLYGGLPVQQVITTHVIESALKTLAESKGISYLATSVGFKNIVATWKKSDQRPTLGVEPNGGLCFAPSGSDFFERDGLGTIVLLLRQFGSVAALDNTIAAVRQLRRFECKQFALQQLPQELEETIVAAWPHVKITMHDSIYEFIWPNGWRALIRRSGTEPLTRCYVEGSPKLHTWFQKMAEE